MSDPYDLERFVTAQKGVYETALKELREGCKRSHWMWFVFPQIAGLGRSPMAQRYAISGLDEARAYLAHPVLGPRLRATTEALLEHHRRSAEQIMGGIDAVKLRSSMTLFVHAATAGEGDAHGAGEGDAHGAGGDDAQVAAGDDARGAGGDAQLFEAVLDRYFDGEHDQATDARL
jgi:uncharacterized protein (DUF1810 family)